MALEGQPPWLAGNKQGYILLEETYGGFAVTVQVIHGRERHTPRVVLAEWVRRHAGGRDAEPDDFYWEAMSGIKAVGLTFEQVAKLNQIVFQGVT
jgi:hypothetical protein